MLLIMVAAHVAAVFNETSCSFEQGFSCKGEDIVSAPGPDAASCCKGCAEVSGCGAFTHDLYDKSGKKIPTCYFKTGCPSKDRNPNAVAGTLGGPPPPSPPSSKGLCGGRSSDVIRNISQSNIWSPSTSNSPSCTSPKVDPSVPKMCEGDATSIVLRTTHAPECISASTDDCRFSMHDITSIEADVDMMDCYGTWSAPLWMTPGDKLYTILLRRHKLLPNRLLDHWEGGGSSGEIDLIEQCPEEQICANFAGGGQHKCYDNKQFSPDNFHGHVSMHKSDNGRVTVAICQGYGKCDTSNNPAVYENIYSSHACTNGQDCMFRLVSDIWCVVYGSIW